jgi:hypothetical protein
MHPLGHKSAKEQHGAVGEHPNSSAVSCEIVVVQATNIVLGLEERTQMTKNVGRIAMLTLGIAGVCMSLTGCGAESVKEAVPPPTMSDDFNKERMKMMGKQTGNGNTGSGTGAPTGAGAAPKSEAPKSK